MASCNFYYYVKRQLVKQDLFAQSLKLSTSALCRILLLEVFIIYGHLKENDDLNHFQRKEKKSQYLET